MIPRPIVTLTQHMFPVNECPDQRAMQTNGGTAGSMSEACLRGAEAVEAQLMCLSERHEGSKGTKGPQTQATGQKCQ